MGQLYLTLDSDDKYLHSDEWEDEDSLEFEEEDEWALTE